MNDHPCSNGLSPSCYGAYPDWVPRAWAYKFLRALLPKQIYPILNAGLDIPLIGTDASLPPATELPPGSIIPPNLTVPENWIPWFHMIFTTAKDPRTLFPVDWKPGDLLPITIKLPPTYQLPPLWTPQNPPHPVFLPGYSPFLTPLSQGALPPLYVQPWHPGPPHITQPEPATKWTQVFSDAYWQAYVDPSGLYPYFEWDGEKWTVIQGPSQTEKGWAHLLPKAGTTWVVDYRPTQARVTFTGGTAPIEILFTDSAENDLGSNFDSVSPQTFDLDFSLDLDLAFFSSSNIGLNITNIEFKGE